MKITAILLLLALCPAAFAGPESRTLKGVSMPEIMAFEGKNLELNGMGLRTKVVFKVYVAGLYLENKSSDGQAIAVSRQLKRMELVFLRAVDGADVAAAITDGFNKNSGSLLPSFKDRMEAFSKMIPDVKKGDKLVFVYRPDAALEISANGKISGLIEGKDFSDVLFKVWLGEKPADKALKAGLLGL